MSGKLTSKEPIPLKRGEYLDCPNVCDAKAARWHKGDAICPECGESAVVYDRATYFREPACRCGGKYPHAITCPQSGASRFLRAGEAR